MSTKTNAPKKQPQGSAKPKSKPSETSETHSEPTPDAEPSNDYTPPPAPTDQGSDSTPTAEDQTPSQPPFTTDKQASSSKSSDSSTPRKTKKNAPPPPEAEPPHGTDCEAYRAWAAEHAAHSLFKELYGPRKDEILARDPLHWRETEQPGHPFIARLKKLKN